VTRLVASRDALVAARSAKTATLASIRSDRDSTLAEIDALEQQSAALAERIRQAQQRASAPAVVAPSGSGVLGWPVSGPVTSGFGSRWGRMQKGIDIGVGEGTPVRAAAAGTVIYAGWMSGYGNLVVVDHGNGLSTAYAHNSSLAVSVGQSVAAGELVSYSGNTGNSTGPHVHFEVRVNGSAVDPLGYL
jgi:murein DD-endopeptidase MepM/ murein hydrolase activator NlpD